MCATFKCVPLCFQVGQTFIPSSVPATFAPSPTPAVVSSGLNDLFELSTGIGMAPGGYVASKSVQQSNMAVAELLPFPFCCAGVPFRFQYYCFI